jgi:hypothetical protein
VVTTRTLLVAALSAVVTSACASLLGPEPTPVPGAAATLTRSVRTPIPTPERTPAASPVAGASPSVAAAASPSPARSAAGVMSDEDVAQLQRRFEQTLSSADLPGIEGLLLDHVSLATSAGGSVLDAEQTAAWLRDHAGQGIRVSQVDRGTQTVMLQVLTEGWPNKDPIQNGQVSFSLRRYDANGRPDEEGGGDWKVDVIEAD